jgi:hypothetical protein
MNLDNIIFNYYSKNEFLKEEELNQITEDLNFKNLN